MAKITKIQERPTFRLELSADEVDTLVLICDSIGGCPEISRRKHADAISKGLKALGVKRPNQAWSHVRGFVTFKDEVGLEDGA